MPANRGTVKIASLKRRREEDDTQAPKKVRQSAWMVTMNTNVRFEDDDPMLEPYAQGLSETLDEMLGNKQNALSLLDYGRYASKQQREVELDYDTLHYEFEIEKAPETQALHAHGLLLIIHNTNLQLHQTKLRSWLLQNLQKNVRGKGLPVAKNVYVHWDYIPRKRSTE